MWPRNWGQKRKNCNTSKTRSKGKSVSVERKKVESRKECVQRQVLQVHVEHVPDLLHPLQNRRQTTKGKMLRKVDRPGGSRPSEKRRMKPYRDDVEEKCTIPSFDSWHPPVCKKKNHKQVVSLAKCVRSFVGRRTDSHRKERRVEERCQSSCSDCKVTGLCISRYGADFAEGHQVLETKTTCSIYVKVCAVREKKKGKKANTWSD